MEIHGVECRELTEEEKEEIKKSFGDPIHPSPLRGGLIPPPASITDLWKLEERVAKLEQIIANLLQQSS